MLTNEQRFFLTAISDYLHDRKTLMPDGLDEALLFSVSKEQQTDAILYYQTHLSALQPSFASTTFHVVNSRKWQAMLTSAFSEAGIPYLIIKGTEIAAYYRHPEFRSMSDLDLLVRLEDKEKAGEIIQSNGFAPLFDEKPEDREWVYQKGNYQIELHHRLLYDDNMNDNNHIVIADRLLWEKATTQDGIGYRLEPEFHFVFLLLHLRKHLLWAGVGIRQFMDIAVMMKNADLDWQKVEGYLSELNLVLFSKKCFAFIERWFGIVCPIGSEEIADDFYESATGKILSDGVFGRQDSASVADNSVINSSQKYGRIRSALSIIFPPYREMKKKYPRMGKYPILLPVMWVRRMIDSVIGKKAGNSLSYVSKHFVLNDGMKQRKEMLKQWGL